MRKRCFNPFDPIQDTESGTGDGVSWPGVQVSTHSIRYRILKEAAKATLDVTAQSFNPFDPIQDTERLTGNELALNRRQFQPIRSDTGY